MRSISTKLAIHTKCLCWISFVNKTMLTYTFTHSQGAMHSISTKLATHTKRLCWISWRHHIEFTHLARNVSGAAL